MRDPDNVELACLKKEVLLGC